MMNWVILFVIIFGILLLIVIAFVGFQLFFNFDRCNDWWIDRQLKKHRKQRKRELRKQYKRELKQQNKRK